MESAGCCIARALSLFTTIESSTHSDRDVAAYYKLSIVVADWFDFSW
jgi:hypothetical protein